MAVYELCNDAIAIAVDSHGAELKSLKSQRDGQEYMWCGDAAYWGRTSPVLFPFVGGVKDKEYRTKGRTYPMTQHGFARDMEFTLLARDQESLWFGLCSDQETLEKYPYEFQLKIGYVLRENQVEVCWQVENPGTEVLPFSIGGHPAFNCPLRQGEKQQDCFVGFGDVSRVVSTRISEKGLATKEQDVYELTNGCLGLTEHLFDQDALVVEHHQTDTVTLCGKDGNPYLKVTMEAPLFGVWSPPGKQAPFVCIEPWYGRCDREDFAGTLEEREWGNLVEPGGAWKASYQITISENHAENHYA